MNQILVTEKLYITPELKRKKKIYKIKFCISIFLILVLFSYYIYAENGRTKNEQVSKAILEDIEASSQSASTKDVADNTTKPLIINDVIIVSLDYSTSNERNNEIVVGETIKEETTKEQEKNVYVAENGEEYTTEAVLTIPCIDISYPVISETSEELLKISLNKYWGNGPNEIGNYCIVGHNYANGKLFGKLSQMEIGDIAILKDNKGKTITYEAYDKYIVNPDDVSCTSQLTGGKREITLITCKTYGTQRLIIKCRQVE